MSKRNPIAQDLRTPKYKTRVVKSKKLYSRKKRKKLRKAMELPFDEGMPTIRKAINKDYRLAFEADIAQWCVRHATEIQAMMDAIKNSESKR